GGTERPSPATVSDSAPEPPRRTTRRRWGGGLPQSPAGSGDSPHESFYLVPVLRFRLPSSSISRLFICAINRASSPLAARTASDVLTTMPSYPCLDLGRSASTWPAGDGFVRCAVEPSLRPSVPTRLAIKCLPVDFFGLQVLSLRY